MKYLKGIILLLAKSLLFGICSIISLQLFSLFSPLILEFMHPFHYGNWIYFFNSPIKSEIVFIVFFSFGVPSILIIDRWFSLYPLRYVFGGAITAAIVWAVVDSNLSLTGNIFTSPWGNNWHLALFFSAFGIATGALYTLLLKALENKRKTNNTINQDMED